MLDTWDTLVDIIEEAIYQNGEGLTASINAADKIMEEFMVTRKEGWTK